MRHTRIRATVDATEGELLIGATGIEFAPSFATHGDQLGMAWDGWQLSWPDISAVERVTRPRGQGVVRAIGPVGQVRIHHDGYARFKTVTVRGDVDEFLTVIDAAMPAAHAA